MNAIHFLLNKTEGFGFHQDNTLQLVHKPVFSHTSLKYNILYILFITGIFPFFNSNNPSRKHNVDDLSVYLILLYLFIINCLRFPFFRNKDWHLAAKIEKRLSVALTSLSKR